MAQVQKIAIPKGTRDFSPEEMVRRNYIFDTVKEVFKLYGYKPIETPSMENLSTLLGKYGQEGDKLLFKVLNSGEAFAGVSPQELDNSNSLSLKVCEKGLRYDLTVPFARYVVQHRNDMAFPFKRYQIQPVWRADRPQKGRYREFYQCDIDVIGSTSLMNELELVQIVDQVFARLGINVTVKINNRKILSGLVEVMGFPDKIVDITVAMDKIDKIGIEAVKAEMLDRGVDQKGFDILEPVLVFKGSSTEKLALVKEILSSSQTGALGVQELDTLFNMIASANIRQNVEIDLSLARGLNYYTGAIFEVKANDFEIGSICGGGRYDNLTGIFGLPDVSGVGISFGADRIYDVLLGLDKFPAQTQAQTKVLFANMDSSSVQYAARLAQELRSKGIACEVYPDAAKLKKQFDYADKNKIPYIAIAGEAEASSQTVNIKALATGRQTVVSAADAAAFMQDAHE